MANLLRAAAIVLIASLMWTAKASAETVEIAPGVHITKKSFRAPINEQPFFGFVPENDAMKSANDQFRSTMLGALGTPEKAFADSMRRGWEAFYKGDLVIAARRFNQASLFTREPSSLYHGFAVIAQARFNDTAYSEELFKVALTRPDPLNTLRGDYARLLLIAKRPAEALPLLEQAVRDVPDFGTFWTNLGFARAQTGNREGACAAAVEAAKLRGVAAEQIQLLRTVAQCDDKT